jgi:hypothetical protein
MTLVEALVPVRVTLRARRLTVVLRPGQPMPFEDDEARRLLERLPGKVRVAAAPEAARTIYPLCPSCGRPCVPGSLYDTRDGSHELTWHCLTCGYEAPREPEAEPRGFTSEPASGSTEVFWERGDGQIARGRLVLLGKDVSTGWVGVETADGSFWWVREDKLRSRQAYEAQQRAGAKTFPEPPDPGACPTCGGRRWWRSQWKTNCTVCHPPAGEVERG